MNPAWHRIEAIALALPGAERSTHYGKPAVTANGRPIMTVAREADSFVLHVDPETKALLIAGHPDICWQTAHYEGWPGLLVRYDAADAGQVAAMIGRSREWAMARLRPRPRRGP